MPYVTAHDGTSLFYRNSGEGPPVVLMHSWALNSDAWQFHMIELSRRVPLHRQFSHRSTRR